MKKKLLLLASTVVMLVCIFAVGASAANTTIEADDLSDIKAAISNSMPGDEITVDLAGDILIPNQASAVIIDKDITLTINFNGYVLMNNSGGGSAGQAYGFLLKSYNAKLVLNGTSSVDPFNYTEPTDETITVSNGAIVNPNKEKGIKSPDFASNGPAVVVYSGTVELNDLYLNQYNTGEWGIFFSPSVGTDIDVRNNIIAKNSIVRVHAGRYGALGTRQGNSILKESYVAIEDCVIYGTGEHEWLSMSANSYIKDTRIADYYLKIDSYMRDSYAREGNEAILQNVIFEDNLGLYTGAIFVNMIDCTFKKSMSIYISGDSQGTTRFTITETADCENAGRQAYAEAARNAGKTLTSFEDFSNVVEQYAIDNPAKGHAADLNNILDVAYQDGFDRVGVYTCSCSRCDNEDVKAEAPALFTNKGFSAAQYGNMMSVNYKVNAQAVKEYENATGKKLNYGVFAVMAEKIGTNDILDSEGKALAGVIAADITDSGFTLFNLKITGFTDAQKKISLAMGAYVGTTKDGATNYTYLQIEKPSEGQKYFFASYNDIVALTPSDEKNA
ncbi:MAG: hypothetical protein J6A90_03480 [Clostridia bacterium]|nr:hypothetical protein [Clostridia bacterium]